MSDKNLDQRLQTKKNTTTSIINKRGSGGTSKGAQRKQSRQEFVRS
jgi:hypothetical protein